MSTITIKDSGSGTWASFPRQRSTPAEVVDSINGVFGPQTYGRAVHAKGIVLTGRFLPSSQAASLSMAPHFQKAVDMTVRFSDFAGILNISDTDPLATPRGFAMKFHLPDGSETDLVTHSFDGFPTATIDEFRQFMIALGKSPPGTATPTPAEKYLSTHPVAAAFLKNQKPPAVSYATIRYYGVNSFKFINSDGQVCYGRYRVEPLNGEEFLTADEIAQIPPDYLDGEIRLRVSEGEVKFYLRVQIAKPEDVIDDPSIAWPADRKLIDAGVINITEVAANSDEVQKDLLFLPAALPEGIEPADPMIQARNDIYHVSYERRHQ